MDDHTVSFFILLTLKLVTIKGHRKEIGWNKMYDLQNNTFEFSSDYELSDIFYTSYYSLVVQGTIKKTP